MNDVSPISPPPEAEARDRDVSWDERYASMDQVWSGEANGALVAEVQSLPAARALDVGCGEGADAIWLAARGWDVTALDVSAVALGRASQAARQAGIEVHWIRAGLLEASLPPQGFDLVSAQYPALFKTADHAAESALMAAVAPGGLLLVVHHAMHDTAEARANGFDPDDYVSPADVAAQLDGDWRIEVEEVRPRTVNGGAGAAHTEDVVLRARRLA